MPDLVLSDVVLPGGASVLGGGGVFFDFLPPPPLAADFRLSMRLKKLLAPCSFSLDTRRSVGLASFDVSADVTHRLMPPPPPPPLGTRVFERSRLSKRLILGSSVTWISIGSLCVLLFEADDVGATCPLPRFELSLSRLS